MSSRLRHLSKAKEPSAPLLQSGEAVSAIIPAHNEAGRIGGVLAVLRLVEELAEIIVVDDGSCDATWNEIQRAAALDPRVRGLRHAVNRGKGTAMFTGARAAQSDLLLFLDADLLGLTPWHVRLLMRPVCQAQADMTLGLFCSWHINTTLAHWITPWLSGQRCIRKEMFFQVSERNASGYGAETALTLTARRNQWRCKHVLWPGVYHPPSEVHRGGWRGLRNRAKMYREILATWRAERGWESISLRLRLFLIAMVLTLGLTWMSNSYDRAQASCNVRLSDLPALPLAQARRVLVVAPHPDDEVLGAGGAIQQALAAQAEVKVVIVTNGDGQGLAPLLLHRKILARSTDYVADGQTRQKESLAALGKLGLPASAVIFLGYPDRSVNRLWIDEWSTKCPLKSSYTRQDRPGPSAFDPNASYCGKDLLKDFQTILTDFRPDLVLAPYPDDDNADHRAVSGFSQMALALAEQAEPDYQPAMWGYLVHYGSYPQPGGLHPEEALLPPAPLAHAEWSRLDLSEAQARAKGQAVKAYDSQMRLLGLKGFMLGFARRNEIFARVEVLNAAEFSFSVLTNGEGKVNERAQLSEPAKETARRLILGSADLTGLRVGRLGDQLWLTAETRGPLFAGLSYQVLVKLPDGQTRIVKWPGAAVQTCSSCFTASLNLAELGYPASLEFSAEVRQNTQMTLDWTALQFTTLDWTGWHTVRLRDNTQ